VGIIEKAAARLGQTPREIAREREFRREREVTQEPLPATPVRADGGIKQVSRHAPPERAKPVSKHVDLDLEKLHRLGMVTPDGGRSAIAEEFRAIKRGLLDRVMQADESSNRRNLIMVSSSLPSEGKTYCSINLAMSIAMELDHTVLLVDADVARPSLLSALGLNAERGLMDILLDRHIEPSDVMLKTNVDTLSILPAGKVHRNATELLASQTMSKLLDEIATRYHDRIVIFDSPPLLLTTESRVLASQMGQIVVVVEAEKTTQKALKTTLRKLEGCANVSLVYNKTNAFAGGETYGYHSYYG
jgi:exopolysaccharide/PEP-CTERM locus tyrosine autokinase